jgi:glycerol-3-phosphate cytidylyltransferase
MTSEYTPGALPACIPDAPVIVYVPGVWDLLHVGHLNLLWRAKALGDVLVVGVVSDAGCHAYKGIFPAENVELRTRHLKQLAWVDVIVTQATTDPTPNLERFRPHCLVHGDDWARLREGQETLERLGIEWIGLPYTDGISSTLLREEVA